MDRPFKKTFFFQLLAITGLCILLYFAFFASLRFVTGHGNELTVPDLSHRQADEALAKLEKMGFQIDIDSTYDPTKKPLEVLDQQPEAGAKVKKGRTIFLVLNKINSPEIDMPNLVNLSFRSAEMLLKNNKLLLGDTQHVPDLANGAVLRQLYMGEEIEAGTSLPQGSKIDLVIGDGYGTKQFSVPDLVGLTYPEAVAILNGSNLNYTVVFDGTITDKMSAVVYAQAPTAYNDFQEPNKIAEGDVVDFRVRQHRSEE